MNTPVLLVALILIVLVANWEDIWLNTVILLTLNRGIISQNCFWWALNDMFADSTGSELYKTLKERGRFVPLNVLGKEIYLVTNLDDIMQLLHGSPNPFGPGILKKNFFDGFIPNNVGISTNPEWKDRRHYNDQVLEPHKTHTFHLAFNTFIAESFATRVPKTFDDFTELTRKLTSKIVFGTYDYNPIVYKVFKQADSVLSVRFNTHPVNPNDLKEFREYIQHQLETPPPNTLMSLASRHHEKMSMDVIVDQIPHWIFPIAGLFSIHLPRLMVMLANHPEHLVQVIVEVRDKSYLDANSHCRKCILELFRLNNAVNSTFRGLTESFQFKGDDTVFEPGTQFVFFNNSILRDLFEHPHEFEPSRWTPKMEESHQALMFNHGNQKCPGKELVITLLSMGLANYLRASEYTISTRIKLNPSSIPYIINPCTIAFD